MSTSRCKLCFTRCLYRTSCDAQLAAARVHRLVVGAVRHSYLEIVLAPSTRKGKVKLFTWDEKVGFLNPIDTEWFPSGACGCSKLFLWVDAKSTSGGWY